MTNLSDLTVLIVDPSDQTGAEYRKSFVNAGADAHVVKNFSAAEKLVETKKIDAESLQRKWLALECVEEYLEASKFRFSEILSPVELCR